MKGPPLLALLVLGAVSAAPLSAGSIQHFLIESAILGYAGEPPPSYRGEMVLNYDETLPVVTLGNGIQSLNLTIANPFGLSQSGAVIENGALADGAFSLFFSFYPQTKAFGFYQLGFTGGATIVSGPLPGPNSYEFVDYYPGGASVSGLITIRAVDPPRVSDQGTSALLLLASLGGLGWMKARHGRLASRA
jgi:hypothetical protein